MSNRKVWWLGDCGHEWETTVANRTVGKGCPYCSGKITKKEINSLIVTHPELIKYWDSHTAAIETISAGSHKMGTWRTECGHSFSRVVKDFVKNQSCPYCNGSLALKGFNDYFTIYPELKKRMGY